MVYSEKIASFKDLLKADEPFSKLAILFMILLIPALVGVIIYS